MLAIFLPTYKRPAKLQEVATNIERTTKGEYKLYFGCEANDAESIKAARATGHSVVINKYDPEFGYSNTIQSIYEESREDVFFHANDDFNFIDGWDVAPIKYLEEHPGIMVIGAHDGHDNPSYSTISFIRREYIEVYSGVVDMPNRVFYPYHHNYIDTEFTRTAQARGLWEKVEAPCIQHNRIGGDETYQKNDLTSPKDGETFKSREHLWRNINKEEILEMAKKRQPMSEEAKQSLRDKAKARAKAKMDGVKEVPKEPTIEKVKDSPVPDAEKDTEDLSQAGSIENVQAARDEMRKAMHENPDMIEAKQAAEALDEAIAKMGQVQGLLASR
jgi:hypothetical protein